MKRAKVVSAVIVLTLLILGTLSVSVYAKGKPGGGGKPDPDPVSELVSVTVTGDIAGSAKDVVLDKRGQFAPIPFTATLGGEISPTGTYDGTLALIWHGEKHKTYYLYFEGPDFEVFIEGPERIGSGANPIDYSNCEAWNPEFGIPPKIIVNCILTKTPQ
jgi:hypothetical protein